MTMQWHSAISLLGGEGSRAKQVRSIPTRLWSALMTDVSNEPDQSWTILFVCWLLVASASLGSLFFSEIMQLPPCSLCWAQRIFMFPLAIILLVGLFPFDRSVVRYALPLALGGLATAMYHALLQMGIIPESAAPCQQGVSCSDVSFAVLGVFSIPILSLIVFSAVSGLLLFLKRGEQS